MKEELMKQVTGLVEFTKEGIIKGVEIIQREAPEIVSQLLCWNFVISLISLLSLIGAIFVMFKAINIIVTNCREGWKDSRYLSGDRVTRNVIWGLAIFISFIVLVAVPTAIDIFTWLKILIAPKLYLIEYFTNLVK